MYLLYPVEMQIHFLRLIVNFNWRPDLQDMYSAFAFEIPNMIDNKKSILNQISVQIWLSCRSNTSNSSF